MKLSLNKKWFGKMKWKVKDWMEDKFHLFNETINRLAGKKNCYNLLDMRLENCSRCISATLAGVIPVRDMRRRYQMPKRHYK